MGAAGAVDARTVSTVTKELSKATFEGQARHAGRVRNRLRDHELFLRLWRRARLRRINPRHPRRARERFGDTAQAYGPWTNEEPVSEALAPVRDQVVIANRFGRNIDVKTGERRPSPNSRPDQIKKVADGDADDLRRGVAHRAGPAHRHDHALIRRDQRLVVTPTGGRHPAPGRVGPAAVAPARPALRPVGDAGPAPVHVHEGIAAEGGVHLLASV